MELREWCEVLVGMEECPGERWMEWWAIFKLRHSRVLRTFQRETKKQPGFDKPTCSKKASFGVLRAAETGFRCWRGVPLA